nr:MAG TPA: hypothetical protein [Caudoviricetes sp.]
MRTYITYISEDDTILTKILYHLRAAIASRTHVPC